MKITLLQKEYGWLYPRSNKNNSQNISAGLSFLNVLKADTISFSSNVPDSGYYIKQSGNSIIISYKDERYPEHTYEKSYIWSDHYKKDRNTEREISFARMAQSIIKGKIYDDFSYNSRKGYYLENDYFKEFKRNNNPENYSAEKLKLKVNKMRKFLAVYDDIVVVVDPGYSNSNRNKIVTAYKDDKRNPDKFSEKFRLKNFEQARDKIFGYLQGYNLEEIQKLMDYSKGKENSNLEEIHELMNRPKIKQSSVA